MMCAAGTLGNMKKKKIQWEAYKNEAFLYIIHTQLERGGGGGDSYTTINTQRNNVK